MKTSRPFASIRAQRGVYAIEFAVVFLIFFAVLYGIICYGILFAFRFGLQNAAEDGARAALRYQIDLPRRKAEADFVARFQTKGWLPAASSQLVDVQICQVETNVCLNPPCQIAWEKRCQVTVTVTVSGMKKVLPPLANFAIPDVLVGKASMLLDGGTL